MTDLEHKLADTLDDLILKHSNVSTYAELEGKIEVLSLRDKCHFIESLVESINNSVEFKELKNDYDVNVFYHANNDFIELVSQVNDWFCPLLTYPA